MRTAAPLALLLTFTLLACGDDDGDDGDDAGASADAASPGADAGEADGGGADAGGGDGADAAAPNGSATILGEIDDEEFELSGAWYARDPSQQGFVLVMAETGPACDVGGGLQAKRVVIEFPCGAVEDLTHPIEPDRDAECDPDAPHVFVQADDIGGLDYVAASGTVDVVLVDDTAVVGDFVADFGADGALNGFFNAVVCPLANAAPGRAADPSPAATRGGRPPF